MSELDYDAVLAELLVGRYPAAAEDVEHLRAREGVSAALSLQTDEDLRGLGLEWAEMAGWWAAAGIRCLRMPVRDGYLEELRARLPACVRALDELLAAGHRVYLHCSAGMNRSPSVAVAWLVWRQGMSLKEALALVKARRPCADPYRAAIEAALRDHPSL